MQKNSGVLTLKYPSKHGYLYFQGNCTYVLAMPCEDEPTLPVWEVRVSNEHREGKKPTVSFTKQVWTLLYGLDIKFKKDNMLPVGVAKMLNLVYAEKLCNMNHQYE